MFETETAKSFSRKGSCSYENAYKILSMNSVLEKARMSYVNIPLEPVRCTVRLSPSVRLHSLLKPRPRSGVMLIGCAIETLRDEVPLSRQEAVGIFDMPHLLLP
jgi:hypothetical protein